MVYIIGNLRNHACLLVDRLGLNRREAVFLDDFTPNGEVPIVISSFGTFHGDTLTLSNKLREADKEVDVKVLFDRHADFNRDKIENPPKLEFHGLIISDEYRKKKHAERQHNIDHCSHAFTIYRQGYLEQLYILGIHHNQQEEQIKMVLGEMPFYSDQYFSPIESPTELIYSPDITKADDIKGKRIHVSIDIDVIKDLECIPINWGGKSVEGVPELNQSCYGCGLGPTIDELAKIVRRLISNNTLVAFDIVGYSPIDIIKGAQVPTEGLEVYRKLLSLDSNS